MRTYLGKFILTHYHLAFFVSLVLSEEDRDLSTDILEYVLKRGESKQDQTIASDILGFVKNKIEVSDVDEIPPEIFKFVLEEENEAELRNATLDNDNETINDPSDTEIIIEDLLPDTIENGDDNIDVNGTDNCDINESYNVLNSTTYIMTSGQDSSSHAEISLQLIQQSSTKLNFVCNFTTSDTSLISSSDCDPEIYLVSGHSTCHVSSLPDTVSARKLAEIHVAGYGEVLVDVTWSEVANTCILIVRKTSCSTSDTEEDLTTTLATPRQQICQSTLRAVSGSRFRSFTSINLSGFTVLLSGSAPRTINIVSSPSAGTVTFAGLEITNFNRYGTWPLLQLPGLTGATAVTIAISMIAGYYGFALLTASSANNRRLSSFRKRKGFLQPTPPYHREKRYKRRSKSQRPSARSSNSEEEILMSIVDKTLKDINEEWSRLYKVGSYS